MRYLIVKDRVVVNIVESDGVPAHDADYAIPDYGLNVGDSCKLPYLLDEIVALEAKQPRAIREAVLSGDKTRVQELEAQIAELRAKL